MSHYKQTRTRRLLQSQIEAAQRVTRSNAAAAEYLRVSYGLYKKFAKQYFDESGVSLFDKHKNQAGRGSSKARFLQKGSKKGGVSPTRAKLDDILLGKYPNYPRDILLRRLVASNYFPERCVLCGFHQRRATDHRTPLALHHKNGDRTDHRIGNLEILCYNCYFVHVGDIPRTFRKSDLYQEPEQTYTPVEALQEELETGIKPEDIPEIWSDEEKMDIIKKLREL